MNYGNLLVRKENSILYVTFNRPKSLNALNAKTLQELTEVFELVYSDNEIFGVILTGTGEKAFVAGADISEFAQHDDNKGEAIAQAGQAVFKKIEDCPKPVIAAVNGFALGGGCELAMACHMRVASENAKFGQPEVNLGVIPGYGGTQRLTALVGKGKALELMLTGDMIDAKEAYQHGLVNYVLPQEEMLTKAEEILGKIFSKSPYAVAKTIEAVNAFSKKDMDGFGAEAALFGQTFAHADKKEGVAAFLEKRKPSFR